MKLVYPLHCLKKKTSSLESWYHVECYLSYDVKYIDWELDVQIRCKDDTVGILV